MKHILKYQLEYKDTKKHFHDNLYNTNRLSTKIFSIINSKKGSFFTLLPENAEHTQVYKFKEGGILQQNPIESYKKNNKDFFYSWIPNIRNEIVNLIYNEIFCVNKLCGLFDDDSTLLKEVVGFDLFEEIGCFSSESEIYYLINNLNSNKNLIQRCLKESNALWHSLAVFTKADFQKFKKKLSEENLEEICNKTELVMVWAYDSEGYVFWEKEGCHFFKSCDNK